MPAVACEQEETLSKMSKKYGLILPGQQNNGPARKLACGFTKPTIFDESSTDSDDNRPVQMQMKKTSIGPSLMEKRKAKNLQEKALAEDPTIFQYDELYDEMENKRDEEKQVKRDEPKKPRYIIKLMETAERRKLENELRIERQVQKEREAEGEEFRDKEAFVTTAYRKKLEEMRKLEEQNKRDDYLEAIGDVTKQKDLDGFYRHIYEQKTGTSKDVKKPELLPNITNAGESDEGEIAYKPITSDKAKKQRAYRKRISSDDEAETEKDKSMKELQDNKIHLTNNIDADSDFSIDDTESESDTEDKKQSQTSKEFKQQSAQVDDPKTSMPEEPAGNKSEKCDKSEMEIETETEKLPPLKLKRDKTEIWCKRTVGEVYTAAVKRYYERKAARNQA